jgi:hypothetical protein
MPVRLIAHPDAHELTVLMNARGLDIGSVRGPIMNSSGHYIVFYDATDGEDIIYPSEGPLGFSWGSGAIGTVEVLQKKTNVPAENLGAITTLQVVDTLSTTYILPGSVIFSNTGGTGPTLTDNGKGKIVEQGTTKVRGEIDYGTGDFTLNYLAHAPGSGNLEAEYDHSDLPDSADFPDRAILKSISVAAASDVAVAIYEDEALTVPVFEGTITVSGGAGSLSIDDKVSIISELDLTKRNRRWIVVDVAVTDLRVYWQRAPV